MISSRPRYIGETKNQLREGFGVYNYPNGFFRYEGEWLKGQKHGHGKLVMRDGSFYEGQFEKGEISGSGVRKWSINGNFYEGEFQKGELHGKGIMKYGNGSVYEGDWNENMRQGEGRLSTSDGAVYIGSFYKNKKHGDGVETASDGQTYEGGWVCGTKQGHGIMKFSDGSIYEGQWRADMFNGEGSFSHCSGAFYHGIWVNGKPEVDASEIVISGEQEIEVEQGQPFDLEITCENTDREQSHESGRTFLITAGVRSTSTSTGSIRKSSLSNETTNDDHQGDGLISTPFGFDVEPYPIVEAPSPDEHQHPEQQQQELQNQRVQSEASFISSDSGQGDKPGNKHVILSPIADQSPEVSQQQHQRPHQHQHQHHEIPEDAYGTETEKSFEVTKVKFQEPVQEKIFSYDEGVSAQISIGEDSTEKNLDVPSLKLRTNDGKVFLKNLLFPPASQAISGSLLRSSPDSEGRLSVKGNKKFDTASIASSIHVEKEKKKGKSEPHASDNEKGKDRDSKRKKERKEDKPVEEKFCKPGDYVIIVQDVTNPPFLGVTLQTAYLHVKIALKSKRSKNIGRKVNAS